MSQPEEPFQQDSATRQLTAVDTTIKPALERLRRQFRSERSQTEGDGAHRGDKERDIKSSTETRALAGLYLAIPLVGELVKLAEGISNVLKWIDRTAQQIANRIEPVVNKHSAEKPSINIAPEAEITETVASVSQRPQSNLAIDGADHASVVATPSTVVMPLVKGHVKEAAAGNLLGILEQVHPELVPSTTRASNSDLLSDILERRRADVEAAFNSAVDKGKVSAKEVNEWVRSAGHANVLRISLSSSAERSNIDASSQSLN